MRDSHIHLLVRHAVLVKLNESLQKAGICHHGLCACPAHVLQTPQDDHTLTDLHKEYKR